jgi:hypothetical protein
MPGNRKFCVRRVPSFGTRMAPAMISDYHGRASPHEENTMRHPIAAILFAALVLAACSRDETPPPAPKLFAEQRDALDRAKDVGTTQLEAADQQRRAMEQQAQ